MLSEIITIIITRLHSWCHKIKKTRLQCRNIFYNILCSLHAERNFDWFTIAWKIIWNQNLKTLSGNRAASWRVGEYSIYREKTARGTWSITRKRDVFHLKKSSKVDVEALLHSNIKYSCRFSNIRVMVELSCISTIL